MRVRPLLYSSGFSTFLQVLTVCLLCALYRHRIPFLAPHRLAPQVLDFRLEDGAQPVEVLQHIVYSIQYIVYTAWKRSDLLDSSNGEQAFRHCSNISRNLSKVPCPTLGYSTNGCCFCEALWSRKITETLGSHERTCGEAVRMCAAYPGIESSSRCGERGGGL